MKRASIIVVVLAFIALAAVAATVEYEPGEKAKCEDEGGCHLLSMRALLGLYEKGIEAGKALKCGA